MEAPPLDGAPDHHRAVSTRRANSAQCSLAHSTARATREKAPGKPQRPGRGEQAGPRWRYADGPSRNDSRIRRPSPCPHRTPRPTHIGSFRTYRARAIADINDNPRAFLPQMQLRVLGQGGVRFPRASPGQFFKACAASGGPRNFDAETPR
jgi:hypothetical protein